jgi:predicted RNA-binding Zn ribbon-like protein
VRIAHLNAVLRSLDARAQLTEDRGLVAATTDRDPVRRLGVLCADALARAVAVGGTQRVGTCAAPPCRCVYIDRTRAARQRYCCDVCNDRAAATAYRARQRQRVAR